MQVLRNTDAESNYISVVMGTGDDDYASIAAKLNAIGGVTPNQVRVNSSGTGIEIDTGSGWTPVDTGTVVQAYYGYGVHIFGPIGMYLAQFYVERHI